MRALTTASHKLCACPFGCSRTALLVLCVSSSCQCCFVCSECCVADLRFAQRTFHSGHLPFSPCCEFTFVPRTIFFNLINSHHQNRVSYSSFLSPSIDPAFVTFSQLKMERDTNQMSQSPSLCRSGCGFYGNPSSDGLCSKCYKDALKRKQAAPTTASSSSSINVDNSSNIKTLIASSSINSVSSSVSAISAQESSNQSSAETKIESNNDLPKAVDITESTSETPKTEKKKKTKCAKCRINVGVIAFPCRCGGTYCGTHRYASEHNCTFDYKEHGAEEIRKNNPQVIGEKVQKI